VVELLSFLGPPSFVLARKLEAFNFFFFFYKALKIDLKRWNDEVFGSVERKKILLEELRVFDVLEEERTLGIEEKMKKAYIATSLTLC
jgi:hypothetical protein